MTHKVYAISKQLSVRTDWIVKCPVSIREVNSVGGKESHTLVSEMVLTLHLLLDMGIP